MAKKEDYSQEAKVTNIEVNEQNYEDVFLIVKNANHYLIALTNQIVSKQQFASVEEAKAYIQSKPWELIFNATAVMMAMLNKQNEKK